MSASGSPITAPGGGASAAGRWNDVALASIAGLGMFLATLDFSLNVALPAVAEALGADLQSVQWLLVVFIATRAGIAMGAGSLADRIGLRPIYLWATVTYAVSMFCIAYSPDLSTMVGFRVMQAIGTGALYAVSPAIAANVFPAHRRGLGMGFTAGSHALGMLAGTLGAGLLIGWLGWEWTFLGRVPFAAVALVLAFIYLQRSPAKTGPGGGAATPPFDIAGAFSLVAGILCLVIGLRLGRSIGWDSLPVLVLLPLAPLLLWLFWRLERTASWAVLPLHLLRNRGFAVSTITMFLAYFCAFVIWFIFPFYVADSLLRGPVTIGILLGINALMISGFSGFGGWLSDRTGTAPVGVAGMLLMAAGLANMAFLDQESSLGNVGFRVAIVGTGLGLFQASAYALMMKSVPEARFGTAGAALSLAQAVGSVLAIAILGSVFAWRSDYHLADLAGIVDPEGVAFVKALRDVYLLGSVLALLGAVVFLFGVARRSKENPPEGPPAIRA